jgi:hypothetical protein
VADKVPPPLHTHTHAHTRAHSPPLRPCDQSHWEFHCSTLLCSPFVNGSLQHMNCSPNPISHLKLLTRLGCMCAGCLELRSCFEQLMCPTQRLGTGSKHVCVVCVFVPLLSVPLLPLYTSTPVPLLWSPLCSSGPHMVLYSCTHVPLQFTWVFFRFQPPSPGIDRFVSIDWSVSSTQHRGRYMLRQNKSLRDFSVLSSETGRACQHPVCKFN